MNFPARDPGSTPVHTMDFSQRLGLATIASATWVIEDASGTSQPAMLIGLPSVTGSLVLQQVQGGTDGATYLHRCAATLSTGVIVYGDIYQLVRKGA